jgi:hypothetical protein
MPKIWIKIPTTNCTTILERSSTRIKFEARIFSRYSIKREFIRNMVNMWLPIMFESVTTISWPNLLYLFYLYYLDISNTTLNSISLNLTNLVLYKYIGRPNMCKPSFSAEFNLGSKIKTRLFFDLRLLGIKWFNSKQVLTLGNSFWQSSVHSQLVTQHTAPPTPTIFCNRMTPWDSLPLWTTKSTRVTQIQSR